MQIDILTLFPDVFVPIKESILKRAQEKGLVKIKVHNLRKWSADKHSTVDTPQYGGGAGMVIRVDVLDKAIAELKQESKSAVVILLSPQGTRYNQQLANSLTKYKHLILIAGHYEGFDQRIREHLIDMEVSIGDYVLTGGELPAMVLTDSIVRLIPGVLGDEQSLVGETHTSPGHIKHPVYTRPENYKGWKVPEVLLSGDHKKIEEWRKNH